MNPPTTVTHPTTDQPAASFGNALKPANLLAYRQQLGFTDPQAKFVYGYFISQSAMLQGPAGIFKLGQYQLISFEPTGILYLDMSMTQQFTGQNTFVPLTDTTTVKWTNWGLNYHLTVSAPGIKIPSKITKYILGHPWQHQNAQALAHRFQH